MFHNETIDKITYSFEGFKSDGLTNTRTDQEIIYFHIDSNFPLGSLTSLKNTKDYSIYQSFPKPTWKYRIESGRLSTHLGPSWKRKCSILRRFFRPRKKVGHEFFLRHYLSLSPLPLEPPLHAILPYLTTQPSTIALLRLRAAQSISCLSR